MRSDSGDGSALDRFALVTGTSAGVGAAVAARLLDRGWTVVGIARRPASIAHVRYEHLSVDLQDLPASIASIEGHVGPLLDRGPWRLIGLVNNAAAPGMLRPVEKLEPQELLRLYAVNVAAPIWLMGFAVRHSHADAALRIVNVSSGAAVHAFPGLAAYASSKAALRLAGMVLAAELDSPLRMTAAQRDAAILSYEPGIVDTDMQTTARSQSPDDFPWVAMFRDFAARGVMVSPAAPAADIVEFLETDGHPRFSERRLGG